MSSFKLKSIGVIALILWALGLIWIATQTTLSKCYSVAFREKVMMPKILPTLKMKALGSSMDTTCHWLFQKYVASPWEEYWVKNVEYLQDDVCAAANKERDRINEWVSSGLQNKEADPLQLPDSTFSRFHFVNNCTSEELIDYIEPLAGLTRHPYYCLKVIAVN
jgi:hypothetical protein